MPDGFENRIHPTAIIDPSAMIAANASIGPYAVVEALHRLVQAHGSGLMQLFGEFPSLVIGCLSIASPWLEDCRKICPSMSRLVAVRALEMGPS